MGHHDGRCRVGSLLVGAGVGLALAAQASPAAATTYRVGPGQEYEALQQVSNQLQPGDVVEVVGGVTYPGNVVFSSPGRPNHKIIVRGLRVAGKRPVVRGGNNTIEARANHYVFEGLELTGGAHRCFFHHAHDITVRDSVIHDCPGHGLLGADADSGTLLLEYTEVFGCGEGTRRHQIYMATDERAYPGSIFRMQHCYVHDASGGNNVKSRAERNEIYFNWIEGAHYHEIELVGPEGQDPQLKREDSDVVGNVLRKTNAAYCVRVGGDGTGETNGRYRFVHNTFLLAPEHRPVFRIFEGIESIEMHNNVLFRVGGGPLVVMRTVEARWARGREQIAGSNNWIPTGSTNVPASWSGTLQGSDPRFVDLGRWDVRPGPDSPLLNAAAPQPAGVPGFAFPAPLTELSSQPPVRRGGVSLLRKNVGMPDIGAYEGGAPIQPMVPVATASGSGSAGGSGPATLGPARPGAGGGRCGCRLIGRPEGGALAGDGASWALMLLVGIGARYRRRARRSRSWPGALVSTARS